MTLLAKSSTHQHTPPQLKEAPGPDSTPGQRRGECRFSFSEWSDSGMGKLKTGRAGGRIVLS